MDLDVGAAARHLGDVAHDVLGADSLAGAALTADDDALVLRLDQHVAVHVVGQRVNVRRVLIDGLREKKKRKEKRKKERGERGERESEPA